MRQFDYALVQASFEGNRVVDPVTQRKISRLACAFSGSLGASAMTLFVDHARERWPMHAGEIEFMARQATVLSVIRGGCGRPGLVEVEAVIGRYRRALRAPLLFGGQR